MIKWNPGARVFKISFSTQESDLADFATIVSVRRFLAKLYIPLALLMVLRSSPVIQTFP